MTKWYFIFWTGSWNIKSTSGRKQRNLDKEWTLLIVHQYWLIFVTNMSTDVGHDNRKKMSVGYKGLSLLLS